MNCKKAFAAKPLTATFLSHAALILAVEHLQQVTCSKIGHLQQKRTLVAKPFAATTCSDHLQRNRPFAAKV